MQALIINDGKVLILKCFGKRLGDIFYTLPGGAIHEGETLEEALHREMNEEIGAPVKIIKKLPNYKSLTYKDFYLDFETYLCHLEEVLDDHYNFQETHTDILEVMWMTKNDLIESYHKQDKYFNIQPDLLELMDLIKDFHK